MRVIRRGVFETNSSSTHSITICKKENFDRWKKGEVFFDSDENFITKELAIERLKTDHYYGVEGNLDYNNDRAVDHALTNIGIYKDLHSYCGSSDLETYIERYTTEGGEELVIFGYFGYNG